jgi:murein endopeptidase
VRLSIAVLALLAAAAAAALALPVREPARVALTELSLPSGVPPVTPAPVAERPEPPRIRWRRSLALGEPAAGRLVRGVHLPAYGEHFFTWDPVLRRSPDRSWRRWGTDRLVRVLLRVAREFAAAHPQAPRMAIGDLSRPRGGDFGIRFGPIGHASHQNGLDADIYYPRADGRERAPRAAGQIDRRLSQDLVDRFLAAGAEVIFVGPSTGLAGPPGRVQPLVNHDNHLHVRLP